MHIIIQLKLKKKLVLIKTGLIQGNLMIKERIVIRMYSSFSSCRPSFIVTSNDADIMYVSLEYVSAYVYTYIEYVKYG